MPKGNKATYTGKQKRQASRTEKGDEKRGTPKKKTVKVRASVNKKNGVGKKSKKSGSGRRK